MTCRECDGKGYTVDGDRLLGYRRYACVFCHGTGEQLDDAERDWPEQIAEARKTPTEV